MRGLETDRYEKCFIPSDTKIEDNSRAFKLQKANFDKEVNSAVSLDGRSSDEIGFYCCFSIES